MHIRYACGDIRFGREVAVKEGTLGEMESSGKSNCSLMRKSRYWPTGGNTAVNTTSSPAIAAFNSARNSRRRRTAWR